MPIRHLEQQTRRVETGPVQFGDDWPGLFIRGDNAMAYAMALESVFNGTNDRFSLVQVKWLIDELRSCNVSAAIVAEEES